LSFVESENQAGIFVPSGKTVDFPLCEKATNGTKRYIRNKGNLDISKIK
jgi:hypothetical protein